MAVHGASRRIYDNSFVKRAVLGWEGRTVSTNPSPSASVDLAWLDVGPGWGWFPVIPIQSPRPRERKSSPPAGSASWGRREREHSSIYSGVADKCSATMKKDFKRRPIHPIAGRG